MDKMNNKGSLLQEVTRITIAVILVGFLAVSSFWVLRPFLIAFLWATMIVVTTWPLLLALQKRLWGKRTLAAVCLTLLLLLVLVLPLTLAIATIVDKANEITSFGKSLASFTLPPPPPWLNGIPLFGSKLMEEWLHYSQLPPAELSAQLSPYAVKLVGWIASEVGSVGLLIMQFLLTVVISAILYIHGETAATGALSFARRLAGENGEEALVLAGKAIRGVALGVVVTAIVQSMLGGIGLAVVGLPAVSLLTAVMFILCIAQIGPGLVMTPAIIWVYYSAGTFWGTVLLIWSIPVLLLDNLLRPILIKKGADLPLLLIFAGVIGGLLAFGIIGLFLGPVLLAVTYTLLVDWVSDGSSEA
jgi:predicted PurR-regulated permease PerM